MRRERKCFLRQCLEAVKKRRYLPWRTQACTLSKHAKGQESAWKCSECLLPIDVYMLLQIWRLKRSTTFSVSIAFSRAFSLVMAATHGDPSAVGSGPAPGPSERATQFARLVELYAALETGINQMDVMHTALGLAIHGLELQDFSGCQETVLRLQHMRQEVNHLRSSMVRMRGDGMAAAAELRKDASEESAMKEAVAELRKDASEGSAMKEDVAELRKDASEGSAVKEAVAELRKDTSEGFAMKEAVAELRKDASEGSAVKEAVAELQKDASEGFAMKEAVAELRKDASEGSAMKEAVAELQKDASEGSAMKEAVVELQKDASEGFAMKEAVAALQKDASEGSGAMKEVPDDICPDRGLFVDAVKKIDFDNEEELKSFCKDSRITFFPKYKTPYFRILEKEVEYSQKFYFVEGLDGSIRTALTKAMSWRLRMARCQDEVECLNSLEVKDYLTQHGLSNTGKIGDLKSRMLSHMYSQLDAVQPTGNQVPVLEHQTTEKEKDPKGKETGKQKKDDAAAGPLKGEMFCKYFDPMLEIYRWRNWRERPAHFSKVSFSKTKGITWLKMIFWVPQSTLEDVDSAKQLRDKVEADTGLVLAGFVSDCEASTDGGAVDLLKELVAGNQLLWLQFPAILSEEPLVYSVESGDQVPHYAFQPVQLGRPKPSVAFFPPQANLWVAVSGKLDRCQLGHQEQVERLWHLNESIKELVMSSRSTPTVSNADAFNKDELLAALAAFDQNHHSADLRTTFLSHLYKAAGCDPVINAIIRAKGYTSTLKFTADFPAREVAELVYLHLTDFFDKCADCLRQGICIAYSPVKIDGSES
eukprot:s810_g32.t1